MRIQMPNIRYKHLDNEQDVIKVLSDLNQTKSPLEYVKKLAQASKLFRTVGS